METGISGEWITMKRIYTRTCRREDSRGLVACLYVPEFEAWALERVIPGSGPVVALEGGRAVSWNRVPALREVRAGDRADRIARLCPAARIRIRDRSVEGACWEDVLDAVHRLTPFMVSPGPPWAWFRIDTAEVVRTLASELGVRVGVAADRATAQLAAVRSADRRALGVPADRRQAFLDRFDVGWITALGFPDDVTERLRLFGYPMLGSLAGLTLRHLRAQFGPEGERLHDLLHPGTDPEIPLHVPPPAVEVSEEPDGPVRDAQLEAVAGLLVERACGALGERRTQRIVLEGHPERGVSRRASRLLPEPHHRVDALRRFVLRLLPEAVPPDVAVMRLVLRFEALRRPEVSQSELFDARPAVLGAVRRVHRRFPGLIRRAVLHRHALMPEDEVVLAPYADDGPDPP